MRDYAFQTATCRHCGGEIERVADAVINRAAAQDERRTDDDDPSFPHWWHTATGHADCDVRIPQAEPI